MTRKRVWGQRTTGTLEPVGVGGLITAWNAKHAASFESTGSAIADGCTVVIKAPRGG